jgi:hypothetical protein
VGKWLAAIIAVVGLLALVFLVLGRRGSQQAAGSVPTADPVPAPAVLPTDEWGPPVSAILTASDAISRTRAKYPARYEVQDASARLLTHATYDEWVSLAGLSMAQRTQVAEMALPAYANSGDGLWLVSILGSGLTATGVLGGAGFGATDSRPSDGMYVAWDANSGDLMSVGALVSDSAWDAASVAGLPTADVPIQPVRRQHGRSKAPSPGDIGDESELSPLQPPPTFSPEELATVAVWLTEQAIRNQTGTPTP